MMDASAFNFDSMKEAMGTDPFADANKKFVKDERFYTLSKNKDGDGAALIRFLPDSESAIIKQMFKINTTIIKNDKKRFVSEFSPSTIGLPCPFQEAWQDLWNTDKKEEAKVFGRAIRYISNIMVIKDPANPENEGKVFLYDYSGKMKDKIEAALRPSQQDRDLGATPKELFNPVQGNSFRLVAKKGANTQINYDSSEIINEVTSVFDSAEEAFAFIKAHTYTLSDLTKPEAFMSYDDLVKKKEWVTWSDQKDASTSTQGLTASVAPIARNVADVQHTETPAQNVQGQTVKNEAPVQTEAKQSQSESLESLLSSLNQ